MIKKTTDRVLLRNKKRSLRMQKHPELAAAKNKIAGQVLEFMEKQRLTKSQMAKQMQTSRAALNRLLDPSNPSVTLQTIERAASALGKKLKVEIY